MSKITAYIDGKKVGQVKNFVLPVVEVREIKDVNQVREVKAIVHPKIGIKQAEINFKIEGVITPPNFDNDVVINEESAELLRKAGVVVIDSDYIKYDIETYRHPNCETYMRKSSELKRKLTESRDRVIAEMIKTRVAIGDLPILNYDYPQYWRY